MTDDTIKALTPTTALEVHGSVFRRTGLERVADELRDCLQGYAGGHKRARFILKHYRRLDGDRALIAEATIALMRVTS